MGPPGPGDPTDLNASGSTKGRFERDRVVNYLNAYNPKDSQIRVEAVAINTLSSKAIYDEAHEKRCEYLVTMWQGYWLRRISGPTQGRTGAVDKGSGEYIPSDQGMVGLYNAIVKASNQ